MANNQIATMTVNSEVAKKWNKRSVAIRDILSVPGVSITSLAFDPKSISVRVLNRACRFIESGYIVGNGASSSLAATMDTIFGLKLEKIWSTNLSIPYDLPLEDQEKLKQIVTADHTAYLLTSKKSARNRYYNYSRDKNDQNEYVKSVLRNNLEYLDRVFHKAKPVLGHHYGNYHDQVRLWNDEYLIQAMEIIKKQTSSELTTLRNQVSEALKKGEPWTVQIG